MFQLLVLLSLLASNAYEVVAVTLDASLLTQRGFNNESSNINIGVLYITDIDPNAFKGYTKLINFNIEGNELSMLDFGLFKDSVNLTHIDLMDNPLTQLTNTQTIVFTSMNWLALHECLIANLDSNLINSLPNLETFVFRSSNPLASIKPNQLSPWKKLQVLVVLAKNQTSLTKEHFTGLNSLSNLIFTDSHIKTVEVHTLLALPNVTSVDLSNNDITAFEYLQIPTQLRTLNLEGNRMNYFMLSITMGYLKYLNINKNLFRSFKSMNFTFLANLTFLDLSDNPHAYPYEIGGHMKPLVNLNEVWLNNLSISSIDSNFFKYNTNLLRIYLKLNKISTISYDAFVNLKDLFTLDLSYNQIGFLDNRTFVGLDKLNNLNLKYNKLTKIASKTFYNLDISYLDLSNNLISEINSSAFSECNNLIYINLDSNNISKIWPRAFENLSTGDLILNNNKITEIDNSTFAGVNRISFLYLSNNNISRISPGAFSNIYNIDLNNNSLAKIENETFLGLNQLISIDLRNNMITTIEAGAFNDLTNLQYVSFHNNLLTQLDNSTFAGCINLQGIYLFNNPTLETSNLQSLCPTTAVNCKVYY